MVSFRLLLITVSLIACGVLIPLNLHSLSPEATVDRGRVNDAFLKPLSTPKPIPLAKQKLAANIWARARDRAAKGGIAGFFASVLQVICFMWLRTANNYQNVYGCGLRDALRDLYGQGGVARLYQGMSLAIFQSPLAKCGMTAAYAGIPVLLEVYLPWASQSTVTAIAAACAAAWKGAIMPIEVIKTMIQVKGKDAHAALWSRVQEIGFSAFYVGLPVTCLMSFVGTYPFLMVFGILNACLPNFERADLRMLKNGVIGMLASLSADVFSNPFKVLKTMQQCSSDNNLGLASAFKKIVHSDGAIGLFRRGLQTRLLVNVLQGAVFTIFWRLGEESIKS